MRYNLKVAIESRFGSQVAFAKHINLHPVKVSRLVCGWSDPTPVERDRIAAALNADPAWLFSTCTRIPAPTDCGAREDPAESLVGAGRVS